MAFDSFTASGSLPYSFLNIEPLTGSNYKKWREEIEIYLSMYHLDWPLYKRQPAALTATSSEKERDYFEEWHRQNRVAKNVMKKTMSDTIRGSIEEPPLATDFMTAIGERFQESEKAQTTTLLNKLLSTKYTGSGSIREHILKLVDYATKLKALKIPVSDDMIIHHALNSLPDSFEHLNTTYLAQKDKWTLNELISVCVQVEDRLKKEKTDKGAVVNLVGKSKWKGKFKGKKFNPKAALAPASASKIHKPYEMKCYFCRKPGHIKKDCTGFKAWLVKKGIHKEEGTKK
ncbi:hypothetical protein M0R45_016658 [Rubus argutus]|uniref:CCHC-type domain-containing protein n=3 Tax=Rubus argutus TaxID=59490 RepID=A0AAW1XU06_RUBAR